MNSIKGELKAESAGIQKFFGDFKAFINKGNVVDLAVAVVIGGAFGKIVTSIVSGLITPLIGLVTGGVDLSHQKCVLKAAENGAPALTLNYGEVLQSTIDFLIIAFCIFILIKLLISMRLKAEEAPAAPPAKTPEVEVLEQIRDLLKKN